MSSIALKCAKRRESAQLCFNSMALALNHSLLFLCFLFFPNVAAYSFTCGDFSTAIEFPFTTTAKPSRGGHHHLIECHGTNPMIQFQGQGPFYHLRNITYSPNIITVQDVPLVEPPWGSGCSFLYDFKTPLPFQNLSRGDQIVHSELTYCNCTMIEHFFWKDFFLQLHSYTPCKNYNFYYTRELDDEKLGVLPTGCSARGGPPPLFEWNISFTEDNGNLSILSFGFSQRLQLRVECFNCTAIGDGCSVNGAPPGSECRQGTKSPTKKIIIGVVAGVAASLAVCCALLLYRFRRRRQSSSSLLLRADSSEPSSKKDPELGSAYYQTQTFSYKELEEATDSFSASKELGDGGFGTVYKGKLRDGRTVAVKRLYENNYKRVEQFMNEIVILSRLRHQNLVTLYGCSSRHSRELLLVYEFVPNGTVADHLHGPRAAEAALTWPVRMSIAIETADALAYLHAIEPQIIHRDVKTNNILLDSNFHVKVADFGLSRLFPVDATHVSTAPQGTPGYVDPEYHQCYQLTDKSDVYSFGVVLVELISSMPAVDISRHRHEINLSNMAINKIQNRELDQLIDPALGYQSDGQVKCMITQVAELAFRCLQAERDMRPAIKEALEVLRAIESSCQRAGNAAETDANATNTNDTPLLKDTIPYSPDTVTDKWASRTTTPNTSS